MVLKQCGLYMFLHVYVTNDLKNSVSAKFGTD